MVNPPEKSTLPKSQHFDLHKENPTTFNLCNYNEIKPILSLQDIQALGKQEVAGHNISNGDNLTQGYEPWITPSPHPSKGFVLKSELNSKISHFEKVVQIKITNGRQEDERSGVCDKGTMPKWKMIKLVDIMLFI